MKATKPKTNIQLVRHIMEYSQVGALKQAFVIEALYQYSQQILDDKDAWPQNSFVSQEAWQTCAEETLNQLKGEFK
jgi:aminopeptidase-like protein